MNMNMDTPNVNTLKASTLRTFPGMWLFLVILLGLSSCKLEIDASGSGSGNVQTVSGTIDCDYDGSNTSNDCAQEYVNDITECDNYVLGGADTWAELPECTEVLGTYSEDFLATPDENSTFGGWHQNCIGGAGCSYSVNSVDNDDTNIVEVEAKFEPEATPEDVSYTYNHLGQRKSKTVGTSPNEVTTYYIYGPGGELLVEQTDESPDPLIKTYIYMDGELTAIHEKQGTSENLHYVINNHLGQPMYMISQNNALHFERYQEPFGKTYSQYQVNAISDHNTRFPGQTYEVETGYHQNWHRDYDPETGRYLQSDPLGLYDGPNTYAYVQGNPVNYIDQTGLFGTTVDAYCRTRPDQCYHLVDDLSTSRTQCSDGSSWVEPLAPLIAVAAMARGRGGRGVSGRGSSGGGRNSDTTSNTPSKPDPNRTADDPLPRDANGVPIPESRYPHTQLGTRPGKNSGGPYRQAREFDENGNPVRDIDFTDHGRGQPNPHQHRYVPNPTGGTLRRSKDHESL